MAYHVLFQWLTVVCLIMSTISNNQNEKSSYSVKLDLLQRIDSITQKPKLQANGKNENIRSGEKRAISNAFNLYEHTSEVDARTGSFRFTIPVGYYNIGTESVKIELGYSSSLASADNDDFDLGLGWYLNFPYIKYSDEEKTALFYPGDGSAVTITDVLGANSKMRYQVIDNYQLFYDNRNMTILKNGQRMVFVLPHDPRINRIFARFYSPNMEMVYTTTAEYATYIRMKIMGKGCVNGLCAMIDRDKEFIKNRFLTRIITNSTFTSSGEKVSTFVCRLEGLRDRPCGKQYRKRLETILCEMTDDDNKDTLELKIIPMDCSQGDITVRLLKKIIDVKSGYEEEIEWYKDNLLYNGITACRVSKFVQKYGCNKKLKWPIEVKNSVTEYFYGDHSYLGSPSFAKRTNDSYADYLMEQSGTFYFYSSTEKLGSACIEHNFDQFHREYQSNVYSKCFDKNTIMESVVREYACPRFQVHGWELFVKHCDEYKHYLYPTKVTTITYDPHTHKQYEEWIKYTYDDHGQLIKEETPTGLITTIEYGHIDPATPNGGVRYIEKVRLYATRCQSVRNETDCLLVVENTYEKWFGGDPNDKKPYPLLRETRYYYYSYGQRIPYRVTRYHRYKLESETDPLKINGKLEWEEDIFITDDNEIRTSWAHYSYNTQESTYGYTWLVNKSLQIEQNKTIVSGMELTDLPTGMVLANFEQDRTATTYKYDIDGRILNEMIKNVDDESATKLMIYYEYEDKPNENTQTVINKGNRTITKELLDNSGRTQEIQISTDGRSFESTHLFEYNEKNQITKEYDIVGRERYWTIYEYNALGELELTWHPTGVKEIIEYGVASEGDISLGLVERTYSEYDTNIKSSIECSFINYGAVQKSGVVLESKKDKKVSCTNLSDMLWMKMFMYNSFLKPVRITVLTSREPHLLQYKKEYKYDTRGRFVQAIKYKVPDNRVESITFYVHNYQGYIKEIFHHGHLMGEQVFDGIGRLERETTAGIQTEYNYNSLGQRYETQIRSVTNWPGTDPKHNDVRKITTHYNKMGNVENETAALDNDFKLSDKQAVTLKITYDDNARIIGYNILGKHKKVAKAFEYDDLLNTISNVEITIDNGSPKQMTTFTDCLGRVTHGTDFMGIKFTNTFNGKNQLSQVKYFIPETKENYKVEPQYDDLARISRTIISSLDSTNSHNKFATFYVYNYYGFLESQTFHRNYLLQKFATINYFYDDVGRLTRKLTFGIRKKILEEKYSYSGVKLKHYECTKTESPINSAVEGKEWGCPPMTDGTNTYDAKIAVQNFTYDVFDNIIKVITISDKNQILTATYNYDDQVITRLLNVTYVGNGFDIDINYHTIYKYDGGGNVISAENDKKFIYSMKSHMDPLDKPRCTEYKFNKDNKHKIYRSHDEVGSLYYYQYKQDNEVKESINLYHDGNGALISEQRQTGGGSYVYGGGQKIGFIEKHGTTLKLTSYYLDSGGTVSASIKEPNDEVERERFSPFGSCARNMTNHRIGFQNMWTEDIKQMMNADNGRMYDPALGRFLQIDPISIFEDSESINPYIYAADSPTSFSDTTGERRGWRGGIARRKNKMLMMRHKPDDPFTTIYKIGEWISKGGKTDVKKMDREMYINTFRNQPLEKVYAYQVNWNRIKANRGTCGHYCMAKFLDHQGYKGKLDMEGLTSIGLPIHTGAYKGRMGVNTETMKNFIGSANKYGYKQNYLSTHAFHYAEGKRMTLPDLKGIMRSKGASGAFVRMSKLQGNNLKNLPTNYGKEIKKFGGPEKAPAEVVSHWLFVTWKRRNPSQLKVYERGKMRTTYYMDKEAINPPYRNKAMYYSNVEVVLYQNAPTSLIS